VRREARYGKAEEHRAARDVGIAILAKVVKIVHMCHSLAFAPGKSWAAIARLDACTPVTFRSTLSRLAGNTAFTGTMS